MCGIIGYVGHRAAQPLLLDGLATLEYRGYDSAGIALERDGRLDRVRAVGNLASLRAAVATADRVPALAGTGGDAGDDAPTAGIGHTRWATHGRVSESNAHPHDDTAGRIQVVLNGIVENHAELRAALEAGGHEFTSQTDAEAVSQLVGALYEGDLMDAVRAAYAQLHGNFAFVAISADEPGLLVGARREAPLVIGAGDGEQFIASAISAFAESTDQLLLVEDGELVALRADGIEIFDAAGAPVSRDATTIDVAREAADRGGFETFMLKEIHEQSAAVARTLDGRLVDGQIRLPELGLTDAQLADLKAIRILACGTSLHAGMIARYAIERWARVPVEVEVASEFRYRDPVLPEGTLVVGITQSGETADTLAAMRLASEKGASVVAVTNVAGSQAARDADATLLTRAGIEIGVAATKTFVAQVTALYLFGLKLATVRESLEPDVMTRVIAELQRMPQLLDQAVQRNARPAAWLGEQLSKSELFMFLGRDIASPVAMEGALKLKEITYLPADAYAAGEMKHGPIALIGEDTPVVVVATGSPLHDKLASNIEEVAARGARVIAIVDDENSPAGRRAAHRFTVPAVDWLLSPLLAVVPMQLLAYELAVARGLNVDQPRNLAKTVTVE
jgi:glucosamine--fructose-6-phosphate aminotransferase (isomerizing)